MKFNENEIKEFPTVTLIPVLLHINKEKANLKYQKEHPSYWGTNVFETKK